MNVKRFLEALSVHPINWEKKPLCRESHRWSPFQTIEKLEHFQTLKSNKSRNVMSNHHGKRELAALLKATDEHRKIMNQTWKKVEDLEVVIRTARLRSGIKQRKPIPVED